jgi:hypothetical protein
VNVSRRRRRNRQQARRDKTAHSAGGVDEERFAEPDWIWVGDRRMFVVDYTPGGAPIGCYEDEFDDWQ